MINGATWTSFDRMERNRRGEIELDALARLYLGDVLITDRDRIAFALRELRKRGYDVEARPVDWTKPLMICSVWDSMWWSFGDPRPSKLHRRLDLIAQRTRLMVGRDFDRLLTELYPEEENLFDHNDYLQSPYEYSLGDPALVEAIFQAVGFATQHGLMVPDDGSETHRRLGVAPAAMVIV
jgi:hypothetical protein